MVTPSHGPGVDAGCLQDHSRDQSWHTADGPSTWLPGLPHNMAAQFQGQRGAERGKNRAETALSFMTEPQKSCNSTSTACWLRASHEASPYLREEGDSLVGQRLSIHLPMLGINV